MKIFAEDQNELVISSRFSMNSYDEAVPIRYRASKRATITPKSAVPFDFTCNINVR